MSALNITITVRSLAAMNGLLNALDLHIDMETERSKDKDAGFTVADGEQLAALKTLRKEIA